MLGNVPTWDISVGFNCRNGRNFLNSNCGISFHKWIFPLTLSASHASQPFTPREPLHFGDRRRKIVSLKNFRIPPTHDSMQPIPRNRSKRAARRPSSPHSRRCGQAQESLAMPADAKAAPVSPNPEPASSSKAGPPCTRQEARNTSGEPCSRPPRRRPHRRPTRPGPSPTSSKPPLMSPASPTPPADTS